MDAIYQIGLVFAGLLLVFLNGFFVASEFSIVKVRGTRIQELIRQGNARAESAGHLVSRMDEYLSATQLGITLASLGLGWIGEPAFATLFEPVFTELGAASPVLTHSLSVTAAFLLITFLHIVLGELAPKSLAIQMPEPVVLWSSRPLVWFYRISYPFIWALNGAAIFSLRLFGVKPVSGGELAHSEEELRLLIAHSQEKGLLDREAKRLLERVFDFAERSARQVMVRSSEVVYLDIRKSLEENLEIARRQRHTRYPLCDGSFDHVIGIVHVKELFWQHQKLGSFLNLQNVQSPVQFVPDAKPIRALLTEFRKSRVHLAVVVDEYGGTVGIVTMEDILEELVGEIQDEFDREVPVSVRRTDENHFLVRGRTLLENLESELGIKVEDEENDTIAGHVMTLLGRVAHVGDVVEVKGFRVRVVGMEGLQITDLMFERMGGKNSSD
ncbi:MAG: HlyC/CorC family transporter [Acidobacteria bacterium]|nr:HlyC/CorC family transporter [Acidobacteriota bacterium]